MQVPISHTFSPHTLGIPGEVEGWMMPFEAPLRSHPLKTEYRKLLSCWKVLMKPSGDCEGEGHSLRRN